MRASVLAAVVVVPFASGVSASAAPTIQYLQVTSSWDLAVQVESAGQVDSSATAGSLDGAVIEASGRTSTAALAGISATVSTSIRQSFLADAFAIDVAALSFGGTVFEASEGDRITIAASHTVEGVFRLTEGAYLQTASTGISGTQVVGVVAGVSLGIDPIGDRGSSFDDLFSVQFFEAGDYAFMVRSFVEGEAGIATQHLFANADSSAQMIVRVVPAPAPGVLGAAALGLLAARRRR